MLVCSLLQGKGTGSKHMEYCGLIKGSGSFISLWCGMCWFLTHCIRCHPSKRPKGSSTAWHHHSEGQLTAGLANYAWRARAPSLLTPILYFKVNQLFVVARVRAQYLDLFEKDRPLKKYYVIMIDFVRNGTNGHSLYIIWYFKYYMISWNFLSPACFHKCYFHLFSFIVSF